MKITNNVGQYFVNKGSINANTSLKEKKDSIETQNVKAVTNTIQVDTLKTTLLAIKNNPQKIEHRISTDRALYLLNSKVAPSERLLSMKEEVLGQIVSKNNKNALLSKGYDLKNLASVFNR